MKTDVTGVFIYNIIHNSVDGIFAFDREYRYTVWNPAMERFTGVPQANVLGRQVFDVFPSLSRAGQNSPYINALNGIPSVVQEQRHAIPDIGPAGLFETHFAPLQSEAGEIVGGMGTVHNLAPQKQSVPPGPEQHLLAKTLDWVGQTLHTVHNLSDMLDLICQESINLFQADAAYIWLVQENELVGFAGYGRGRNKFIGLRIPLSDPHTLGARVIRAKKAIFVNNAAASGEINPELIEQFRVQAILGMPLVKGEQAIGALMIVDTRRPYRFGPDDVKLANVLGRYAATAVENARLYDELHRRIDELAVLNEIGQSITASLDLQETLTLITAHTTRLLNVEATSVALCSQSGDKVWFAAASGQGADFVLGKEIEPGRGIAGWVAQHGEPVLVPDVLQDPRFLPDFDEASGFVTRSVLCVPLQVKGKTIGLIEVLNKVTGPFNRDDLHLLNSLAASAAVAIENARLLEAEREQRRLANRLREATTALASALELNQVLEDILTHLQQVIDYDSASIFLIKGDYVEGVAARGLPRPETVVGRQFPAHESLFLQKMDNTDRPVVLDDAQADPQFKVWGEIDYIRGWMGVPLLARGRFIGFLAIDSRRPAAYGPAEASLAQAFAGQAAVAIENARLYQAEQDSRRQAEALRRTALALVSTMDLDEVIDRILTELQQVVPYDSASVQLLKDGCTVIIGGRGFPNLDEIIGLSFPVTGDNADWINTTVIETKEPFIIADTAGDARKTYRDFFKQPHAPAGIRSWLGVPMLIGQQAIGMITLDKRQPGFFTQNHAHLASAYAAQAAVAIENARLYQQARQEIEERKRAETALAEERNLLRTLIDSIPDYVYVKDTRSRFVMVNTTTMRSFGGKTVDDIIGKTDFDFHSPELAQQYYADEQAIFRTGRPLISHEEPVILQGREKWFLSTKVPLRDSQGQIIGLVGIGRDITGRKRAEAELQTYREYLETLVHERTVELEQAMQLAATARDRIDAILRSVADGLVVTDLEHRVILANPAAETLLGRQSDEILGRKIETVSSGRLPEIVRDTLEQRRDGFEADIALDAPANGYKKVLRVRTALVEDRQGQSVGVVTIIQDVTRLREIDRLKTELLTTASHELRTPLASILGFSEILLTRNLDQNRQARFLRMINEQASHLSRIVSDLLDISRLEAGRRLELELAPVYLDRLMQDVVLPFTELEPAYTFRFEGLEELPPVQGDPFRLAQVGRNLISNAVNFSPEGSTITIRGRVRPDSVEISIQDEGIGMTHEQQKHLFEPFYRADSSNTAAGGPGLGLAISRMIIEQHGGRIWLDSEKGGGTTAFFTLPLTSP